MKKILTWVIGGLIVAGTLYAAQTVVNDPSDTFGVAWDRQQAMNTELYGFESGYQTWKGAVTETEMGYLAGVTSDIQTQLGTKLSSDGDGSALTDMTLSQFGSETPWRMFYSNGAGLVSPIILGDATQILTSNGVGAAPTFEDAPAGGGGSLEPDVAATITAPWTFEDITLPAGGVTEPGIADGAVSSDKLKSISYTTIMAEPDQLQPIADAWMVHYFPAETYPAGVTIDSIHIASSEACTDVLNFEEWPQGGTAAGSTVEAITLSGTFTEDSALADPDIAADGSLYVDLPATPSDIASYMITVIFHAN